jgi:hypothetical protein
MNRAGHSSRRRTWLRAIAVIVVTAAVGFAWSGDVGADQPIVRFVAPLAVGQGPCDASAPCDLAHAVAAAQNGDEIVVEPGRYELAQTLTIDKDVALHGSPGPIPAAEIRYGGAGPALAITSPNANVSDLAIEALGQSSEALAVAAGTAQRIRAESLGPQLASVLVNGGVLRDSLVLAAGPGAAAVESVATGASQQLSATVDHVTAVATGSQAVGLLAQADAGGNVQLSVGDSILSGTAADLSEQGNTLKGSTAAIATSHDDFSSHVDRNGGKLSDDGTSISGLPAFVSAATDDFREAAGSPTIDAAAPVTDKSELDLGGGARAVGEPDIGAFEANGSPYVQLKYVVPDGLSGEDVSAVVVPNGSPTTYAVEFGPTAAYGKQTQSQDAGSGMSAVSAEATIDGLAPQTTYHYRFVVSSPAGVSYSQDGIFLTASTHVALAYTGGSSAPAGGSAQLAGSANPGGLVTTVRFEWGTSTAYGSATSPVAIGAGDSDVPAAATLSALRPGTTYHYRFLATNADGTNGGIDETFTTPAGPRVRVGTAHATLHKGQVAVRLACPRSASVDCRGRLTLSHAGRAIGSVHYDVPPGRARVVDIRLSRRARRALIRAGREAATTTITPAGQPAGQPHKLILNA